MKTLLGKKNSIVGQYILIGNDESRSSVGQNLSLRNRSRDNGKQNSSKGSRVDCTLIAHLILQTPLIILAVHSQPFILRAQPKLSQLTTTLTIGKRVELCLLWFQRDFQSRYTGKEQILLAISGFENVCVSGMLCSQINPLTPYLGTCPMAIVSFKNRSIFLRTTSD